MTTAVNILRYGGEQVNNSSGNVAAAAATATLTSRAGYVASLTGFEVTGAGATGASIIAVTVTGLAGGTLTWNLVIPAGATTSINPLVVQFAYPLRASAANTNIVVSAPSFGAGNTNACTTAHGFLLPSET
jgi:hypothetical protein